jgi:hypothetical protein
MSAFFAEVAGEITLRLARTRVGGRGAARTTCVTNAVDGERSVSMARTVTLPLPLPQREREEEGPVRPSVAVPDTVLKAVMEEMERTVSRREREPERRPAPTQERARYNYD